MRAEEVNWHIRTRNASKEEPNASVHFEVVKNEIKIIFEFYQLDNSLLGDYPIAPEPVFTTSLFRYIHA